MADHVIVNTGTVEELKAFSRARVFPVSWPGPLALLIGLTGGIASGKSAVADIFASLGVPVLDTDQIARDIVEPGAPVLGRLVTEFGEDILDASGRLDRARMRERVFAEPAQRLRLEAITHPAIRAELARRSNEAGGAYQVHVVPLLVGNALANNYDRVLVVDVPESEQVKRLITRDRSNEEQARRILAAQATREQRLEAGGRCDCEYGDSGRADGVCGDAA